jgi:hypothetical protein
VALVAMNRSLRPWPALLLLLLAVPLPALAGAPWRAVMLLALGLGLLVLLAATSEQVQLDGSGIRVGHPSWCGWLLRRGWQLEWSAVTGLTPVATSQGGRVFYVRSASGAYLLPQRVQHFDDFLQRFAAASGQTTSSIGRISPPWTYRLLAALTTAMLLGEAVAGWAWLSGRWAFPPAALG